MRSVLLAQFRKFIGLLPTLYKYCRNFVIKHDNIAKDNCLAFRTNIFCVSKPTFNSVPQNHVGSNDEAFLTRQWCEWRCRENRWHMVVSLPLFVIKALIALHEQDLIPVFNYDKKSVNVTALAVISMWLWYLCDCEVYVAVIYIWPWGLCGCDIYVTVRFMWLWYLCDCEVYVAVISIWPWGLCGCDIYVTVGFMWLCLGPSIRLYE